MRELEPLLGRQRLSKAFDANVEGFNHGCAELEEKIIGHSGLCSFLKEVLF